MNFKKIAPVLALLMSTSILGGCQSSSTNNNKENTTVQVQVQEQVYTVQVESIEGQTITATQGELTQSGPPALPEGESMNNNTPPTLPEDQPTTDGNTPPALPEGDQGAGGISFGASGSSIHFSVDDSTQITIEMLQGTQEGTLDNIGVNDVLEVTLNENNIATSIIVKNLSNTGGFGGSHEVTQGTYANIIDTDSELTGNTYTSTGDDENALRVNGVTASLTNITINKLQGESSNTENGDFYGQNAGFLATDGANVTIKNATVTTSVTNGNGIFSYGDATSVKISDSTIQTSGSNSGGIQTTGGATMEASNLQVETQGNSAAAIRSDRGGGTVNVSGGSYTTNGTGSPAIYSTADISVSNATLTAHNSEALVIEGKNSITLENCDVTGNMDGSHLDDSENLHNIMIYQSMSGDAAIGHSTFSATGGTITAKQGDMIYVTNTTCSITLNNVKLMLANDMLLNVTGNSSSKGWGTQGSNGGDCNFDVVNQTLEGKIRVDDISSLNMSLGENSTFTGSINEENSTGSVKLTLDATSKWTLTGDSYLSEFEGDLSHVTTNGFKLYVNGQIVK